MAEDERDREKHVVDIEFQDDGTITVLCGRGTDFVDRDLGPVELVLDSVAALFVRGLSTSQAGLASAMDTADGGCSR